MTTATRLGGRSTVDSHLHVWDLDVCDYPWLGPEHGDLHRTYTPAEAGEQLAACGVGRAVLVQAADSLAETQLMLDVAAGHAWVAGVVGWVPLDDPPAAEEALLRWEGLGPFRGVRHLVHGEPRADFLDLPEVRRSLRTVARYGHPLDVPDAWPRHLAQTRRLAREIPDLVVVVDHLAKPPRGRPDFDDWRAELARVSAVPNTVAKVSGLQLAEAPYDVEALRPVWEIALEGFGPDRLMFGSDWPMTVPHGGYRPTYELLTALIGELTPPEQDALLGGTAERVYRLS